MALSTQRANLAAQIQTGQFRQLACDPDHPSPTAFKRRRKLSLPTLIDAHWLLKSVQTELDAFFGLCSSRLHCCARYEGRFKVKCNRS